MDMKTAAISVRVSSDLKAEIEAAAKRDARSLASYVERVLTLYQMLPQWQLRDANPLHRKESGPSVSLSVAEGWPLAVISADHAEALGRQLIEAARIGKSLPPAE
jgi:hypothetical protein